MNLRTLHTFAVVLLCTLAPITARAQSSTPSPTISGAEDADALFDRAADMLLKDPVAARPIFSRAASAYENLLTLPLSQSAQARVLSNAGAAHHLAGDFGPAMLDLRRAELLSPATPNLRVRLAATRAAVRTDSAAPATPPASAHEADLADLARDLALSAPHQWLWRAASLGYACFWSALLLRLLIPHDLARKPGPAILVALAALFAIPAGAIAALHFRDASAATQAVVLHESIGRSEPDDLTGAPSSPAPLKPGSEIRVLAERSGGDGRTWIRIAPIDAPSAPDDSPIWIPESAAARVLDTYR